MPVSAIVGRPGAGKSFVMASIAHKHLKRGRRVFANFNIDGAERFDLAHMADLPPGLVLVDEAQNWFHSRMWSGMPEDMLERWSQTRKAGWDVFLGTQHESNMDAVVRRVVQWGWLLEPRWSTLMPGGRPMYIYGRRWDWPDFRKTQKGHRHLEVRRWWWNWEVARSYDTFEVTRLRGRDGVA